MQRLNKYNITANVEKGAMCVLKHNFLEKILDGNTIQFKLRLNDKELYV